MTTSNTGRDLKWRPEPVTSADRTTVQLYKTMYADEQNQKTKKRLRKDYNRFLELNSQEDKDDIPFLLMAQMKRHGLSAGSTSTYLQGLLGKRSSAAKAAGKRHADKPSGHAEDADMSKFGVYNPQLWMMAATGMHAKDAQKLRVLQMSLGKTCWDISFFYTTFLDITFLEESNKI